MGVLAVGGGRGVGGGLPTGAWRSGRRWPDRVGARRIDLGRGDLSMPEQLPQAGDGMPASVTWRANVWRNWRGVKSIPACRP